MRRIIFSLASIFVVSNVAAEELSPIEESGLKIGIVDGYAFEGKIEFTEINTLQRVAETGWTVGGGGSFGLPNASLSASVERLSSSEERRVWQAACFARIRFFSERQWELIAQDKEKCSNPLSDEVRFASKSRIGGFVNHMAAYFRFIGTPANQKPFFTRNYFTNARPMGGTNREVWEARPVCKTFDSDKSYGVRRFIPKEVCENMNVEISLARIAQSDLFDPMLISKITYKLPPESSARASGRAIYEAAQLSFYFDYLRLDGDLKRDFGRDLLGYVSRVEIRATERGNDGYSLNRMQAFSIICPNQKLACNALEYSKN